MVSLNLGYTKIEREKKLEINLGKRRQGRRRKQKSKKGTVITN
jgi:hypothetical protein